MNRTVLIVEDEADILIGLRIALELKGYRVLGSASAEEALKILEREEPDAVLLDIRLPGMDGWEMLSTLQETGRFPGLPVIVISAHAEAEAEKRASDLGCSGYLTKPFGLEQLHEALSLALGD